MELWGSFKGSFRGLGGLGFIRDWGFRVVISRVIRSPNMGYIVTLLIAPLTTTH